MKVDARTDEREVLLRLQQGEVAAFEQLYHRYNRKIYYNLLKLVHLPDVTAELHQDVFLKIWQHREQIDTERPFDAYMTRIARNIAVDFYRKAAREKKLMEQLSRSMTEIHDPIGSLITFKESNQVLEKAISKLPPQRQQIFRLIKLEHKSYEYAALHYGVSVGTIKDHMAKATLFLRKEMNISDAGILFLVLAAALNSN